MDKRIAITWILLLLFTITVGTITSIRTPYAGIIILCLSALKFLGVAFLFMDLKAANSFWKNSIITFLVVFFGIILVLI